MRPTRGVLLALVLAVVLHQLARITGGGWLALAAGACLALPVAALVLRPRLADLQVTSSPVHARVGQPVEQRLTVRNAGTRPTPVLQLVDISPGLARTVVAVPALRPGAEVTAVLRRTATARGWSADGEVELVTTAPLGLLRVRRCVRVPGPFAVAPQPVPLTRLPEAGPGSGGSSLPVAGSGVEVLGLRPWRPGDGARAVSARASARHGRPVVLERERDGGTGLVVLCAGAGSGPAWERAIEQSCALAEHALRSGVTPTLVATGPPVSARSGRAAVLDWHARLDAAAPADEAALAQAVRAAGPGGAVVLLGDDAGHATRLRAAGLTVVGTG